MLRRNVKKIIATALVVSLAGAGVAVAAAPSTGSCPYGHTPAKAGQTQTMAPRKGTQQRLRERDGTGPRHAAMQKNRTGGNGQGSGNRGVNCPYRS